MSSLTQCNYCSYMSMKRRGYRKATSKERKKLWDTETSDEFRAAFGAGIVMVDEEGKFASWMMEVPSHCCC